MQATDNREFQMRGERKYKVFKDMTENFPNLMKNVNLHIQKLSELQVG